MKEVKQGTKEYNRIYSVYNKWYNNKSLRDYKVRELKGTLVSVTVGWARDTYSIYDIKRKKKYHLQVATSRFAPNIITIWRL